MLPLSLVDSPLTCLSFHLVEAVKCQMSLELLLAWGKKSPSFLGEISRKPDFFSGIWINGEKLEGCFVVISTNSLINSYPAEKWRIYNV